MTTSQEIRRKFLQYFKSKGHTIVPSSPVLPHDDPSLLFINAGMNQFKDVFLGKSNRSYTRATSSQKCIRAGGKHNDLENVGHTSRHLTFFEMLGNFSFGDYFKKEAIEYAYDIATNIYGLDPDKIWPTVYTDDDEAFALWEKYVPSSRIVRFGEEENFWSMGDTGPCGPCSELLYDRGGKYSDATSPLYDLSGERYLEFWNLVFMQYNRDETGKMTPLPKQSIDTGAGLERIVALKMGVDNVYLTDILRSLIAEVENISKIKYDEHNRDLAPAFNVISDHIRTLSFAIADGIIPSNVDRGYVLRKILRRAARYGRLIGLDKPFLAKILPRLISLMGEDFPEIIKNKNQIQEILTIEEESFIKTLNRGGSLISDVIVKAKKEKRKIKGDEAFKLKDTYGFPIEEILLIAKDEHLEVDLKTFNKLEHLAKEKSRKAHVSFSEAFEENFFTDFTKENKGCEYLGHHAYESESKIIGIIRDNKFVESIKAGQEALIILDKTPFYAEMGGQVGDSGFIQEKNYVFDVTDTQTPFLGVIAHIGKLESGELKLQDKVHAKINEENRHYIQNNHTATHLLNWALTEVLGEHIKQKGSLVEATRLRFDFDHHKALSVDEIKTIERMINKKIRTNKQVKDYVISYEQAQKDQAIKQFFGEKYLDKVRVIDIEFSKELCGGAHTSYLGTIGLFKIAKESSIAAGVRRIEAMSGSYAEDIVYDAEDLVSEECDLLKTKSSKLLTRTKSLLEENKTYQQTIKSNVKKQINTLIANLLSKAEKIGSYNVLAKEIDLSAKELPIIAEDLLQKLKSAILILATKDANRCQVLIKISPDIVEKGIFANDLIKEIAPIIQGGGGGKKDSAQAGGKDSSQIQNAFDKLYNIIKQK